jgi:hypothetical protein
MDGWIESRTKSKGMVSIYFNGVFHATKHSERTAVLVQAAPQELSSTYQGAVKNTRTGRDRSFERTLSANSFSVSIIFPPDLAIPSCVVIVAPALFVIVDLAVVLDDILVVRDVSDGTKALLVAKDVERMIQMMEIIGNILTMDDLFDRERSSSVRKFRR